MLRKVQIDGRSVHYAVECFGFSRPTFYRALQAFEQHGLPGLLPDRPGPRQARKLKPHIINALLEVQQTTPAVTIKQLQQLLQDRFELSVHRTTIERALHRAKQNSA